MYQSDRHEKRRYIFKMTIYDGMQIFILERWQTICWAFVIYNNLLTTTNNN